ncbi:hypothetical protein AB7813_14670 [Tardiphaga sp. 20_F10_N6_6]|uniref:hypothetical protein n=1 Tax=Tardiphaga sp. 20_F10_N6_6 TaxID=3240788 RepID=UPI003F89A861
MTDVPNQTTQTALPKKRWRWWQIGLAALTAIFVVSLFRRSPELKVTLIGGDQLQVINIGQKAVDIQSAQVNDRDDCKVTTMLNLANPNAQIFPIRLEVGGGVGLVSFCRVVRAKFGTSAGSADYKFR